MTAVQIDVQETWVKDESPSALNTQIGGDHYKTMAIQPMEFSMANGLDACQHTAIKYIARFRSKGGIEDLQKAKHVIDMLIETEAQVLAISVTLAANLGDALGKIPGGEQLSGLLGPLLGGASGGGAGTAGGAGAAPSA